MSDIRLKINGNFCDKSDNDTKKRVMFYGDIFILAAHAEAESERAKLLNSVALATIWRSVADKMRVA